MAKNKPKIVQLSTLLQLKSIESEKNFEKHDNTHWPSFEYINNLSAVSGLYLYTNPPPMGYGSPAPKVAKSVLRANKYNLKPEESKTIKIGPYVMNKPYWEDEQEDYPFDEITGNFHPGEAHRMYRAQLVKHHKAITQCAEATISEITNTNSDVLTKGRQTWCPIMQISLPSAQAYSNMAKLFKRNLGKDSTTCFEWIQCFFEMMELNEIVTYKPTTFSSKSLRYDKESKQRVYRSIMYKKMVKTTIKNDPNS